MFYSLWCLFFSSLSIAPGSGQPPVQSSDHVVNAALWGNGVVFIVSWNGLNSKIIRAFPCFESLCPNVYCAFFILGKSRSLHRYRIGSNAFRGCPYISGPWESIFAQIGRQTILNYSKLRPSVSNTLLSVRTRHYFVSTSVTILLLHCSTVLLVMVTVRNATFLG